MKVPNKFKIALLFSLLTFSLFASGLKSAHEKTKNIVEEFDVNSSSNVFFSHRRGTLRVKYIDGNKGRVEANITVAGDDPDDVQKLLDAISIDISKANGRTEIYTGKNIKSWSSSSGLFSTKHKIELDNGKEIHTKIDQISIAATLYLPKIGTLSLRSRYDDMIIESCQADQLEIDVHAATLQAADLNMSTKVKIKYGKLDLNQVADFKLESHDSKGTMGNINKFTLIDKYSDFTIGNVQSLDAKLHDANITMGNVGEDANIIDKYSVIILGNMQNGKWELHDSKITAGTTNHLNITSKYTDFIIDAATKMDIQSHDDNFKLKEVKTLHAINSKYTAYDIGKLELGIYADLSHDDDFDVDQVSTAITGIELNGKYSTFNIPIPSGMGYALDAKTKYGQINYPKEGLKESRHIEKDSSLEITAVAADGSSNLKIVLVGHDCKFNLD